MQLLSTLYLCTTLFKNSANISRECIALLFAQCDSLCFFESRIKFVFARLRHSMCLVHQCQFLLCVLIFLVHADALWCVCIYTHVLCMHPTNIRVRAFQVSAPLSRPTIAAANFVCPWQIKCAGLNG
jgi:hypothetical protein